MDKIENKKVEIEFVQDYKPYGKILHKVGDRLEVERININGYYWQTTNKEGCKKKFGQIDAKEIYKSNSVKEVVEEENKKKQRQDKIISLLKKDDKNLSSFVGFLKMDSDLGETLYPEDIEKRFQEYKKLRQHIISEVIININ